MGLLLGGLPWRANALPVPLALFNGRNLAGWRKPTGAWRVVKDAALDPADPQGLRTVSGTGVLVNGAGTGSGAVDLVTEAEYDDVQLHVEFLIPRRSNSGIYVMGRYAVQIYDSFGRATDAYPGIECGGIYPRWIHDTNVEGHSPRVNASRPAGEWQSFDVTFRAPRFDATGKKTAHARFVRVVHNGGVIHEDVELQGPTRGSMGEDEKPRGPIRLQGDHGPVAYRNLQVRPLDED